MVFILSYADGFTSTFYNPDAKAYLKAKSMAEAEALATSIILEELISLKDQRFGDGSLTYSSGYGRDTPKLVFKDQPQPNLSVKLGNVIRFGYVSTDVRTHQTAICRIEQIPILEG